MAGYQAFLNVQIRCSYGKGAKTRAAVASAQEEKENESGDDDSDDNDDGSDSDDDLPRRHVEEKKAMKSGRWGTRYRRHTARASTKFFLKWSLCGINKHYENDEI